MAYEWLNSLIIGVFIPGGSIPKRLIFLVSWWNLRTTETKVLKNEFKVCER